MLIRICVLFKKVIFAFTAFQKQHNEILFKPLNSLVLKDFEDADNLR